MPCCGVIRNSFKHNKFLLSGPAGPYPRPAAGIVRLTNGCNERMRQKTGDWEGWSIYTAGLLGFERLPGKLPAELVHLVLDDQRQFCGRVFCPSNQPAGSWNTE